MKKVTIHYGFGNQWNNVNDIEMEKNRIRLSNRNRFIRRRKALNYALKMKKMNGITMMEKIMYSH